MTVFSELLLRLHAWVNTALAWMQRRCLDPKPEAIPKVVDPNIERLVCKTCWSTVFAPASFRTAWMAGSRDTGPSSDIGFTYVTAPWSQMQDSIEHMCEWCDIVCEEIEFWYHHRTKSRDSPPPEATFTLTVKFIRRPSQDPGAQRRAVHLMGGESNERGGLSFPPALESLLNGQDPSYDGRIQSRSISESPQRNILPSEVLSLELAVENDWRAHFLVMAPPDSIAAQYISERDVVSKMDSELAYSLVEKCIDECSRHKCCPAPIPTDLPTRVIDCSDPSRPRLVITNSSDRQRYVALSYVWGQDQPNRTTHNILDSYINCIDPHKIPMTIRDAISVTHRIGLQYLWVDALCIVQDSGEDKAREIPKIHSNFRNAYLTIIASQSRKVSDGFLHLQKNILINAPSTLPFVSPEGEYGIMQLNAWSRLPPEPIDERAWCLEERVLSPRTLVYGCVALQYECQAGRINVNGSHNFLPQTNQQPRLPDVIFTQASHSGPASSEEPSNVSEEVRRSWSGTLEQYSGRVLTRPHDRLVALGALVRQFQTVWPESRYVAGLWTHQLPGTLLWYSSGGSSQNPSVRPKQYRAPSWSWAAINGSITTERDNTDTHQICEVRDIQVSLKNEADPYGEVTSGYLLLNCILKTVVWKVPGDELYECGLTEIVEETRMSTHPDSENGEIGVASADAPEDVSESTFSVTAAIVLDTGATFLGMLLVPQSGEQHWDVEGTAEVYRRIGRFTIPFSDKDAWLSSPHQPVMIV